VGFEGWFSVYVAFCAIVLVIHLRWFVRNDENVLLLIMVISWIAPIILLIDVCEYFWPEFDGPRRER
jgi:membrane-anchored protein YejM (alkaline phosphatase superfamily)